MGTSDSGKEKIQEETVVLNYGYGIRHLQAGCMWLCLCALFIARSNMAVAVLAMTDMKRINDSSVEIYDWDKNTQGVILSSFFWGYLVMQIPGALLGKRFGGKLVMLTALLINGFICLFIPILANLGGWQLLCAARVLMGLSQAALFPTTHMLVGKWLPPQERTSCTGIIYSGSTVGIVLAMPLSGLLAGTPLGWKSIFYASSLILFTTAGIWYGYSASSPGQHRMISQEEITYIQKELNVISSTKRTTKTPWRQIFTTGPLWAIMVSHVGFVFSYIVFFVDIPTYMEKGLHISLENSAYLSALPHVGHAIGAVFSTTLCEKIYNKRLLSLCTCRKLFNTIGSVGMAVGLVAQGFLGPEQKTAVIVALVGSLTMSGFCCAGYAVNHLDLSPNYSGLLLSLTNFAATCGSVLTPIATSLILRNNPTDLSRWRIVFMVTGMLTLLSNVVFMLFGSADRREWDDPDFLEKKKSDLEQLQPLKKENKSSEATKGSDS